MELENKINKIYTDPGNSGGFAGKEALYDAVQKLHPEISKKEIDHYLEGSRTYTLYKPRKLKFKRSKIIPTGFLSNVRYAFILVSR